MGPGLIHSVALVEGGVKAFAHSEGSDKMQSTALLVFYVMFSIQPICMEEAFGLLLSCRPDPQSLRGHCQDGERDGWDEGWMDG